MNYVQVWSLQRGIISPSLPVDDVNNAALNREAIRASLERDPPMTMEEWWREEGQRCGYKRNGEKRHRAA